jgi:hypothetical protein
MYTYVLMTHVYIHGVLEETIPTQHTAADQEATNTQRLTAVYGVYMEMLLTLVRCQWHMLGAFAASCLAVLGLKV